MGIGRKIGSVIGKALKGVRAGDDKLAMNELGGCGTKLEVSSSAFANGTRIPRKYTSDGEGTSPPIHVEGVPAEARELVLLCEDPDAPKTTPFVHWLAYKIPAEQHDLREGVGKGGDGIKQGRTTVLKEQYIGPAPPPGHGAHHYHFEVFALDLPLDIGDHATRDQIVGKMRGHVVACGDLVGTYER